MDLQDQGVIDSRCSRHMTGNMSYLTDYEEIDRGYVAFGGNPKGGKITGKCTIKTVPRKNNMYSVDLRNIVSKGGLTCLFVKATYDESKLWHRRLGHLNFNTMNKLVKGYFVRGLPSKLFENNQTCVACQKGKQHKASCKSKIENSISLPLHLLHMDLFGLTFVKSLMKKMYCLVVTDDYSRFTWVFFLATKDETSGILKSFINGIENLVDHKVKVIRCDNGTEFKNREMNQFCKRKGILRQFSVARTPQQNGVAERRNRTVIKASRTMLADSKLPTTFWAEAVNTACYVQNRVLVVKPHNKTPYELFHGRTPTLSFMRPFGCHVTILNTIDHLGKFDGKADEGFFVGYSLNSKAFRVFNSRTRIVEESLHIRFSESTSNTVGSGPDWLFDIDALTRTMNYEPIAAGTQSNGFAGTKASDNAGQARKETEPVKNYILLPLWTANPPFSQGPKSSHDDGFKPSSDDGKKVDEDPRKESECNDQKKEDNVDSTNNVNVASTNKIDKTPTMPHDSPLPRVHTLGSDEGIMQHNELMDLVTKLSDRVVALETDLTQTMKIYGAAFTKLIKKVKRLEKKDKLSKSRRKLRLVLLDKEGVSTASTDFTTANVPVTTAGAEISTVNPEFKTVGDYVDDITAKSLVYIRRSVAKTKDKSKGIMEESESAMTKTKRQQEQERLGYEAGLRLQEQLDEEERQRIYRAHEAASSFNIEEWKDIQARIEADEELAQSYTLQQLNRLSFDEIKDLFETTMRRANTFVPMETEIRRGVPELVVDSLQAAVTESTEAVDELSQEELQQLMIIVPEEGMNIKALQTKYPFIDWVVYTEDSRMYLKIIRVGNHTEMLVAKLLVEQDNEMSRELLRKIFMQIERPGR
ncbi:putative ribonuclease H-like domain-containing protein [Tanacetum coccineum]